MDNSEICSSLISTQISINGAGDVAIVPTIIEYAHAAVLMESSGDDEEDKDLLYSYPQRRTVDEGDFVSLDGEPKKLG